MKIHKINLTNFRRFASLEARVQSSVTVIVGTNGSGKTSILDGAAIALGGLGETLAVPLCAPLRHRDARQSFIDAGGSAVGTTHYPVQVEVEFSSDDGQPHRTFRELDEGKEWLRRPAQASDVRKWLHALLSASGATPDTTLPILAYYRVERATQLGARSLSTKQASISNIEASLEDLVVLAKAEQSAQSEDQSIDKLHSVGTDPRLRPHRRSAWISCLDAAADWKRAWSWWALEYIGAGIQGEEVSDLCRAVEDAVACVIGTGELPPRWSASARDIVVNIPGEGLRPIGMLSDGFRSMIALVADLSRRCAVLNPHLGRTAATEATGIVLIDEIDIHLHPKWQREIVPALTRAFPRLQFIVSSHSPQVLSSVPAKDIILVDGALAGSIVNPTKGRDTNAILQAVFGVPERPSKEIAEINSIRSLIDRGLFSEAASHLDVLAEQLSEEDRDVLNLRMHLHIAETDPDELQ